jgi:hypothetical protein
LSVSIREACLQGTACARVQSRRGTAVLRMEPVLGTSFRPLAHPVTSARPSTAPGTIARPRQSRQGRPAGGTREPGCL